jgi:phenylacetate-CoA ligase
MSPAPLLEVQDTAVRLERLAALIAQVAPTNAFQRERLAGLGELRTLEDLRAIPVVGKADLVADQQVHPPFGSNLTYPRDRYTHLHQTSGTSGTTLRVLDTAEDWDWWRRCFANVFRAAGVEADDTVALAHSFGPYVQFWASYEGATAVGATAVPLGGMDSVQRLETMRDYGATTLCCTPSYALHLARVAAQNDLEQALEAVTKILCTGEPGASLPAVRAEIEQAWDARCFDHAGLTEVGSFAYPCAEGGGLHLNETEFIHEVGCPSTGEGADEGEMGELVVTALGRTGFPAIRYATGDIVQVEPGGCPAGHPGKWLPGGILGRSDDMVVIRGMNVFPSAIEQILRESGGIGEFRVTFYNEPEAMDEVKVEVELERPTDARAIQARLRQRLGLRVRIVPLKAGILPRQTGKARRVVDLRPLRPQTLRDEEEGEA